MLLKRRYVRQFIDRVLAGFVTRVNVVGRNLRRVVTDQVTRDGPRNAHRFQLADSRVTKAMKRNRVPSLLTPVALDLGPRFSSRPRLPARGVSACCLGLDCLSIAPR